MSMQSNYPIEKAVGDLLTSLNIQWKDDENFKDTPSRVARSYKEILFCQGISPEIIAENALSATFPSNYDGMVIEKDIQTVGLCPHHLLPIHYSVDIGYISVSKMVGLSKLARLATMLAQRAVLQETYTEDIASSLSKILQARGVIVVVKGNHGCMSYRGVNQRNITTITSSVMGVLESDVAARQEFLSLTK